MLKTESNLPQETSNNLHMANQSPTPSPTVDTDCKYFAKINCTDSCNHKTTYCQYKRTIMIIQETDKNVSAVDVDKPHFPINKVEEWYDGFNGDGLGYKTHCIRACEMIWKDYVIPLQEENKYLQNWRKEGADEIVKLTNAAISLESELSKAREEILALLEDKRNNLPNDCIAGHDEVKFCHWRQGDGDKCQHCRNKN